MKQPVNVSPPPASFGALFWARRHRACLAQEQLAARAELSERTVRNLEPGQVQSPRAGTVRLLAVALQLSEPERESWLEAARGGQPGIVVHVPAGPGGPGGMPGPAIAAEGPTRSAPKRRAAG